MTNPIRVLHFADTHIGMENYGKLDDQTGLSSRVVDFLRRMDEMIEYARQHDVDLVIFAGDAFKTRTPNPTYQREFAFRIQDLAALAPTILLVGNHDIPPNQARASTIEIYDTLRIPNVFVASWYETRVIETKRGEVVIGTAPYPMRSWLLANHNQDTAGMSIAQVDQVVADVLSDHLERLADEADEYAHPRLLTGHFTVSGAVVGSERGIMLGRDLSVPLSMLADSRWDYVALGHIHKHQNLTRTRETAPPVVYSGSMERIDFGEEGDPKGFCWIELDRYNTTWEFIPLSARPFVTIRADLRESTNPTYDLIQQIRERDLTDAVVRFVLQLTVQTDNNLNEAAVRRETIEQGAFSVAAVNKQIEQPNRMRIGTNPEGLSATELLEQYLKTKSVVPARRAELLAKAEDIFNGTPIQEIIDRDH